MRKFFSFFVLLLHLNGLHAKPYIIFQNTSNGLFSIFQMVLSLCECYENEVIQGAHLDFKTYGLYYDPEHGENWWEYYFEPIALGSKVGGEILELSRINCHQIEFWNTREQNKALIDKYIRVKSHIQNKVENFAHANFKDNFVIGLHYRGNDKVFESPPVPYDKVIDCLEKCLQDRKDKPYKIFVATDDQHLLDTVVQKFPNHVCFLPDALRSSSGQPTHYDKYSENGDVKFVANKNPYKNGEGAVIDSLLLAKTHLLIRTSSNLSFISSCMNPSLPVIELNRRHETEDGFIKGLKPELMERCKNKHDPALYFLD